MKLPKDISGRKVVDALVPTRVRDAEGLWVRRTEAKRSP